MYCRAQWPRFVLAAALFGALVIAASGQEPGQPSKLAALARIPELDDLAARVAKDLHKVPRKDGKLKVAIFVFQHSDGSTSRFGEFLSNAFVAALAREASEIEYLDQAQITQTGKVAGLSEKEIADEDIARYLAQKAGAVVLITGSLQTLNETVKVGIRAMDARNHKVLGASDAAFASRKEWLALDSVPAVSFPVNASHPVAAAADSTPPAVPGRAGFSYPECAVCPPPNYSQDAREAKFQGTVVLKITVSAAGTAENIRVLQPLDLGLTEQAILAVKKWKFKPAKDPGGKPVSAEVAIEVTFRLLK